jgi:hypothetical protein
MAQQLSSFLAVDPDRLAATGVLDSVIGIDTHLFLDPHLLRHTAIPEFAHSRQRIEQHYCNILRLLIASRREGDAAWREAARRLIFPEVRGTSIGYGVSRSDGNAIGQILGRRLLRTASEIIEMGIVDPNVFELIGLFEEGFGADRLSDMTLSIIREDLCRFSARISAELGIKRLVNVRTQQGCCAVPRGPFGQDPLYFLPTTLLRDLPVALTREDIDHVVATNNELRERLNRLIGDVWKRGARIPKPVLRRCILGNRVALESLLETYKKHPQRPYEIEKDPAGLISWFAIGRRYADANPLHLALSAPATIDDLETLVNQIVEQFKRNIEVNGLNEHLYERDGVSFKPRHERFSQLLFFSVADTYCNANDVDVSREPNSGSGPVDFKISTGYERRVLVEVKLSSNARLLHGFETQLPTYERSEPSTRSVYLIIRVTENVNAINDMLRLKRLRDEAGERSPAVVIVDGRVQRSASKR